MTDNLPIGAHLVTPRLGFLHHGIYAGNGRVIHNRGRLRFFPGGVVEEIALERFTKGHGLRVRDWQAPKFAGPDCVARARSRLGERRYGLLSNNCEHFSEWCVSGKSRSLQVEAFKAWVGGLLATLRLRTRPASSGILAA